MDLLKLVARLGLDLSGYEKGLNKAKNEADSAGSKIGKGLKTVAKIGAAALGAAATAVTGFTVSAVKAGQDFDSSMSQVAATMGKSVDEIGDLSDFAQKMGATTAFSATQAADALNYMALAGYDADTSMQMLPTVLDLAAAGGIDLAAASDMVTDAQSALGLSIEETSEMVDKMAKASSKSNTSVAQLGEAFLTIGATARNLKGGTTELSTVLGVLADNGIKGAEGGTHLRNILLSLQTPTKDGIAALAELGLTYEDMYDEAGNMRGLDEIMLDLQKRMEGMTQASKDAITSGIFNKTDLAAVNALIGTSSDRYAELTKEIDSSSGAAQNMAKTQLENLAGDMTYFKSALEGVQIALSNSLKPALRGIVQEGTRGLSQLTEKFKSADFKAKMEQIGDKLAKVAEKVVDFLINLDWDKILDGIATAIGLIANAVMFVANNLDVIVPVIGVLIGLLTAWKVVQLALNIAMMANPIGLIIAGITALIAIGILLVKNWDTVKEFFIELWEGIKQAFANVGEWFKEKFDKAKENITNAWNNIGKFFSGVWDDIKSAFDVRKALTWGRDLIDNFVSGIKEKIGAVKEVVTSVADKIKSFLGFSEPEDGPLSNFHTYAPDMMALFAKGIKDNEKLVTDQIAKSFDFSDMVGDNVNVNASGEKTVRHTGTIRLEGVNNEGEFVAASEYAIEDIVVNIMKRQARLA